MVYEIQTEERFGGTTHCICELCFAIVSGSLCLPVKDAAQNKDSGS